MRRRGGSAPTVGATIVWPRALAVGLLCALAAVALPAGARADVFGSISLLSEGSVPGAFETQQAEYAHDTAISSDGRYVAFDGSFHGVTGVWRAEVQGGRVVGEIQQVAGGDAELPSISENGQYISFTTNEGESLAEITDGKPHEPKPEAVNVYVRDMSREPMEEGSFTVASAVTVDGETKRLTYNEPGTARGAVAAGRSAISADGNEVAFVTTAVSDLVLSPQEERGEKPIEAHTPALQVAVRYIASKETKLVSQCHSRCEPAVAPAVSAVEEEGTTYGAVYSGGLGFAPPPAFAEYRESFPPGASISADGSTVAWMGTNIDQQAAMLPLEVKRQANYTEPLWRRIAPGSETPTERVTGGSEPSNPACLASGETELPSKPSSTDPCQGPFVVEEGNPSGGIWASKGGNQGDPVPRLSADGYTVAFLSEAPLVTAGENFGSHGGQSGDLYLADMHPGLTRNQALTQLTELGGGEAAGLGDTAPIFDFGISPDGSQVAFTTERTQFPLGSPAFVSPPAGEPGMDELFDVDLADHTLTRVTHGYQGPDEASEHPHRPALAGEDPYKAQQGDGAISPSFSADGRVLAFSSTADNLVFGDGNAPPTGPLDGSDAFLVERAIFQPLPTPQYVSPAPQTAIQPAWQLGMTVLSRPDGSVLLFVRVPGAGTLSAGASSSVELRVTGGSARHGSARRGRTGRVAGRRGKPRVTVAIRTVASATSVAQAPAGELIALVLKLAPPYAPLASQPGGLSATVGVAFAAPGEPTLRESVAASFLRTAKPVQRQGKAAAHRSRGKKGRRR